MYQDRLVCTRHVFNNDGIAPDTNHEFDDAYYAYDDEIMQPRLAKRYVRDPFNWWSDHEFKKRYQFSKEVVMHLPYYTCFHMNMPDCK